MFTAIISTAIVGLLAMFGIKLSLVQVAGVAIAVKILVVGGIFGLAAKFYRRKEAIEAAKAPVEPVERES